MKKLIFTLTAFLMLLALLWQVPALREYQKLSDAQKRIESGDLSGAKEILASMPATPRSDYVRAYIDYEQEHYDDATQTLSGTVDPASAYLRGNAQYRSGQSKDNTQQTVESWLSALQSYQTAMKTSDDPRIQQNYDFVSEKLKQITNSQDQENQDQGDSQDQQNESGQDDQQESENQNNEQGSQGGGRPSDGESDQLSPADVQAIEQYMQDLQDEQNRLQPYLNRFGTSQQQSPFTTLEEYFFGDNNSGEKDW